LWLDEGQFERLHRIFRTMREANQGPTTGALSAELFLGLKAGARWSMHLWSG
jgi:hypothetical protein